MDNIEKLYKNYEILSEAGEKISEHEAEYLEILEAVKGHANEKRLASQFIARFFKNFPSLADKAIDAQLDLCEDPDIAIRKQAIKDLPSLCKDSREYLPKIADVLAQLLVADEVSELNVVHFSLLTLFKLDAKGMLSGLFTQIVNGEEVVRERAIKFLCTKVKGASPEALTKEVEEYLLQECKKVMQDVTGEEFTQLTGILSSLKVAKTVPGQQALVDLVAEQAELDKDFEGSDSENISRLVLCVRQALNYFSPFVSSGQFVEYMCLRVLPALSSSPISPDGAPVAATQDNVDFHLESLKLLAEMSPFASKMEEDSMHKCLTVVFNKLLEYLPLPPSEENTENSQEGSGPNLHLSHAECLIYTLHQLGKTHPAFLTQDPERLRDFKLRLQFLARGIQGYIKKLREALQNLKGDQLKSEENKLKVVALRTTSNLNTLIKDLFHVPPAYKSTICLSWKTPSSQTTPSGAITVSQEKNTKEEETKSTPVKTGKRAPIVYEDDSTSKAKKLNKGEREIYMPPSGKYSAKVKQFTGFRGRGTDGGWYGRGRGRGRFY